jgi:hypothetical protein
MKKIFIPEDIEVSTKVNHKDIQRKSSKIFLPFHSPKNLTELKNIPEFMDLVNKGFSFIHYRKDSVFHLSEELIYLHKNIEYRDTYNIQFKKVIKEIHTNIKFKKETLWLIDTTKYKENSSHFYEQLSKLKRDRNTGICIRSHIDNIDIKSLEYFDVIFLFDMSDVLFDKFKSFISISEKQIENMKSGFTYHGEPVLVFVNNSRKTRFEKVFLETNPFIVNCESSLSTVGSYNSPISHYTHNDNSQTNINSTVTNHTTHNNIFDTLLTEIPNLIQNKKAKYDVFISHASHDKDKIARPLAEALKELNLKVWYDEFSLQIGDDLPKKIDKGIEDSRIGIIILSPHFIKQSFWTKYEFDALKIMHRQEKQILLPIWSNVSEKDIENFHKPLLKILGRKIDKKYTIQKISQEILELLKDV